MPIGRFLAGPAPDDEDEKAKTAPPDTGLAYRMAAKYSDAPTTRSLASTETEPMRETARKLATAESERSPAAKESWRKGYNPPMTVGKRLARLKGK